MSQITKIIEYADGFDGSRKRDLIEAAHHTAQAAIEGGWMDVRLEYARLKKSIFFLTEVGKSLEAEAITQQETYGKEDNEAAGVKFSIANGAERLNYADDPTVKELEEKLKERKALVSAAYKSKDPIYDSEGVEIAKVSVTHGKTTLKASII